MCVIAISANFKAALCDDRDTICATETQFVCSTNILRGDRFCNFNLENP